MSSSLPALTLSLVREYLARNRELRGALAELDKARPPADNDVVNNRNDLAKSLRLDDLVRRNRSSNQPLSTLLELMVAARMVTSGEAEDSDSSDTDDDGIREDDGGDTSSSDETGDEHRAISTRQRQQVSVSLPMGGPLAPASAPVAAPRPQSARPARPMSAKHGARTPNVVSGMMFPGPTCHEVPASTPAVASSNSSRGGGSSSVASAGPASGASGSGAPKAVRFANRAAPSDQQHTQLIVRPGELNGGVCELVELHRCEVLVLDWSQQITIDKCVDCRMLIGPVDGSVMLRDCSNLHVAAACKQLRCRDCSACVLRLFTLGPIIESSTKMTFAEWDGAYPKLASHFAAAGFDPNGPNKWADVHDFNDPDKTANPPNWTLAPVECENDVSWRKITTVPGDAGGESFGPCEDARPSTTTTVDLSDAS